MHDHDHGTGQDRSRLLQSEEALPEAILIDVLNAAAHFDWRPSRNDAACCNGAHPQCNVLDAIGHSFTKGRCIFGHGVR